MTDQLHLPDAVRSGPPGGPAAAVRPHPGLVEGVHVGRVRVGEVARRQHVARRFGPPAAGAVLAWALLTVVFLAVGTVLAVRQGGLPGDALSRVAAARGVVSGRDPHLEAVGFVWGPFPTLFEVPVAWLARWWPSVTGTGLAAVIVSAGALAAAVVQLDGWGRDLRCPRWSRYLVLALTVAHPLIWTTGVNGMSEACWFLAIVIAGRRVSRWVESDDVVSLAVAGTALGIAYLTRFESLAAIAGAAAVVAVVSYRRTPTDLIGPFGEEGRHPAAGPVEGGLGGRTRRQTALLDVTVLAFPAISAVLLWALACWAITGEALPQLSSQYGNATIVAAAGAGISTLVGDASALGRAWFSLRQAAVAGGAAVLLGVLCLWIGSRTTRRAAVAAAVLGAPLALQLLFSVQGSTFPWLRYSSSAVLLCAVLAMVVMADDPWVAGRRWVRPAVAALLVPGVVISTVVAAAGALGAIDEEKVITSVLDARSGSGPDRSTSFSARGTEVAEAIDALPGIAPGSVLTDTSSTFAVVAAAPRPELYVVPSDRDFEPIVAAPASFGVRYLLIRGPASAGDAVKAQFPKLWEGDPAVATPVARWGRAGDLAGEYLLLAVTDPRGAPPAAPSLRTGASE